MVTCRMAEMKSPDAFFPSPLQVAGTDIATLRTAGLSARKAEYGERSPLPCPYHLLLTDWGSVLDLAAHFADGRLSTEKLLAAEDEELYTMLTSIRGIGRVSVVSFVPERVANKSFCRSGQVSDPLNELVFKITKRDTGCHSGHVRHFLTSSPKYPSSR